MINARPGYWDVDRCSWVGVDPVYVVPPLRHADRAYDRSPGSPEVPAPRTADDSPLVVDHDAEASSPA